MFTYYYSHRSGNLIRIGATDEIDTLTFAWNDPVKDEPYTWTPFERNIDRDEMRSLAESNEWERLGRSEKVAFEG